MLLPPCASRAVPTSSPPRRAARFLLAKMMPSRRFQISIFRHRNHAPLMPPRITVNRRTFTLLRPGAYAERHG